MVEADGSFIEWAYDDDLLTKERRYDSGNSVTYNAHSEYNRVRNRVSRNVNGVLTSYSYYGLDHLISGGGVRYLYYGRGNLTRRTDDRDGEQYASNADDRLSGVTLPNSTNVTNTYDADDRRVTQATGSQATEYLWDEASTYGDVVYEYNGSGATLASYVLGRDQLISQTRGSTTSYHLQDGQGSTRALTGSSGAVTDTYSYNAFGDLYASTGTTVNPYRYTGQQFDSYINLLDYGSRRYDPALGRFISPDSIVPTSTQGVQAWDRYAYANNSPVVNTDPSGHCIWDGCLVEIIALAGLTIAASQIPSDVPQSNAADWGNPDVMVTGLAIAAGAPDIAALAGEGLMGLGKLISNPKLFAAGKASYDAATGAAATTTQR